ncbi:MAG: flagellar biosynthesis protein FlhA, partial [Gammaproteobacteria bacterium]|nr:flagellar biosynthesis protein FlhA [Gammaproteobacteria bacterium]
IGMSQHGLPFSQALENYTLLTIGDGLVAQIPSLLLATAAAIIVTRVNSSQDMGEQIMRQMFAKPKALGLAGGILFALGVVPGMPHTVFLSLAVAAGIGAWFINRRNQAVVVESPQEVAETVEPERVDVSWADVLPVDTLGLEVGYKLIPLVDKTQGGELLSRIRGVRKKLSQELGFLVPSIHIRDNLDLLPNVYRFTLTGVIAGEAEIYADKFMAIDPGEVFGQINGIAATDPAFGLPAFWIEEKEKDNAQTLGYTVVDASTVVATHVNQIMLDNAADLLGHDEVQHLVDLLGESSPKLSEQLVPGAISLSGLLKILQNLLREKIPIKDIRTIAECLADGTAGTVALDDQTNLVRTALGRMIVQNIYGNESALEVITLDPELEQLLVQAKSQGGADAPVIEPSMAEKLQKSVIDAAEQREVAGKPAVILVSSAIRSLLARFVKVSQAVIHVLAYEEIPDHKQITVVSTIGRTG